MANKTKLTLSSDEQQLIRNTEWIFIKRKVIEKIVHFFDNISFTMKEIIENEREVLPLPAILSEPKITKGENYKHLPYVVLDYPRYFNKENIFAIRTMFWWGNFFSITLHLSGSYKNSFEDIILKNDKLKSLGDYYLCINTDQWQHNFDKNNYVLINEIPFTEIKNIINKQAFTKIAIKFSLQQWNKIPLLLENSFLKLVQLLKA